MFSTYSRNVLYPLKLLLFVFSFGFSTSYCMYNNQVDSQLHGVTVMSYIMVVGESQNKFRWFKTQEQYLNSQFGVIAILYFIFALMKPTFFKIKLP